MDVDEMQVGKLDLSFLRLEVSAVEIQFVITECKGQRVASHPEGIPVFSKS